jgi:hypothetical protein
VRFPVGCCAISGGRQLGVMNAPCVGPPRTAGLPPKAAVPAARRSRGKWAISGHSLAVVPRVGIHHSLSMIDLVDFSVELARLRLDALYLRDRRGRLVSVNEWNGRAPPRFHLMRTAKYNLAQYHGDLADDLVIRLEELRAQEPISRQQGKWPDLHGKYLELLGFHAPVARVWAGPVFAFPDEVAADVRTVAINETNAHLLRGGFEDWLPDIRYRQPFCAVVEGNRAVSICASVRITDAVHCAGVATLAGHRRRGYATYAVAGWALTVRSLGASPFYTTSWDNEASQRVAARLYLVPIGVDFHVT